MHKISRSLSMFIIRHIKYMLPYFFVVSLPISVSAQLNNITLNIDNYTVGETTDYNFQFTTSTIIPSGGRIEFTFPAGFDGSGVTAGSATISSPFTVNWADPILTVTLNGPGNVDPGNYDMQLSDMVNTTTTGTNYSIDIQTRDNLNNPLDAGTTQPFSMTAAALDHFILGGEPITTQAGQQFLNNIVVTAFDVYNNIKTNYLGAVYFTSTDVQAQLPFNAAVPYTFTAGDNGSHNFPGNGYELRTVGNHTITVTDGTINQTSGNITVIPGPLARFTMAGEPGSRQAGQQFPNAIVVTAYDGFNNIKTDYAGQVYFLSTDLQSRLPFSAVNRYTFTTGIGADNGIHNFPGIGFELRTTGFWTITVTNGTVNQESNPISVVPGPLARFTFQGEPTVSESGQPFINDIVITAYDTYNNIKTDYTGNVYFTSTDPQAQLPHIQTSPYAFTIGVGNDNGQHRFLGNGFILRTLGSQTITVHDGLVNRASNIISVNASTLSNFTLSCGTTQTAGNPFLLRVQDARDQFGNNWSGQVTVSAWPGGGNSPNGTAPSLHPIQVIAGSGQAYQTLVKAETEVTLRAQAGGVIQTVTDITVNPNALATLKIRDTSVGGGNEVIAHNMRVGETLTLFSAGYDAFGNFRSDEQTNWGSAGLIPELISFNLSSVQYRPTAPGKGIITAANPTSTISDHTGIITVEAGTVTHFAVGLINTQVVGQPFTITVTALDAQNNVDKSFSGTVQLTDLTGTLIPTTSNAFIDGVLAQGVNIFQEIVGNQITVTDIGSNSTGTSNAFDVVGAPGIRVIEIKPVKSDTLTFLQTVTTDQTVDWFLKVKVRNMGSATVRLDSIALQLIVGGVERDDYTVDLPDTFWGNGTNTLQGGETDSLLIKIDMTGHDPGAATIQAFLMMSNILTGGTLGDRALTSLMVQTPADLVIQAIRPATNEVTRGQEESWSITVVVSNLGGSEVVLDASEIGTNILYSLVGTGWQIRRPDSLSNGSWVLMGGETGELVYVIERTGNVGPGLCYFNASVAGIESNTGRVVSYTTQFGQKVAVLIEAPALLRILQVVNLAPNAPYVNTGQTFSVRVTLENSGGDGIHNVMVHLVSDGLSVFPPLPVSINTMAGGEMRTVELSGVANSMPNNREILSARAEGYTDNTNGLLFNELSINDTTKAIIQYPANLMVESVSSSAAELIGGQADPWIVKVAVRNMGQAVIGLNPPKADDLSFWVGGVYQADYKVTPPATLKGGGLDLPGGVRDTLIYEIVTTGRLGGTVEVRAQIEGKDKNAQTSQSGTATTTLIVHSERAFRIISTRIQAYNSTDAGNAYVNTGQSFQVVVVVENGLGETVTDIEVTVGSNGGSLLEVVTGNIPRLTPSSWDSVKFDVQAASLENLTGETFLTTLTEATLGNSGFPAPIGTALDSTAIAIIQGPALLSMTLVLSNPTGQFSINQKFTLKAILQNNGTGEVDKTGSVRIELPSNYQLDNSTPNDIVPISVGSDVTWTIKAPGNPQPLRDIYVTLYPLPNEKNTGNPAEVDNATKSVQVSTVQSLLNVDLSISSPEGAVDGILSAGQSFVIKATIQSSNVTDIKAMIELPYRFTTADNLEKSVISDEVIWQVHAPDAIMSYSEILVSVRGVDALQPQVVIQGNTAQMIVSTVKKADLALNLSITSPPDATDRIVSLGQVFVVSATVVNIGEADTLGLTRVTLSSLTNGYTTTDPLTKDITNGGASWTVTAPINPTGEVVNIEAGISLTPMDENTNRAAYVSRGNHSIGVTTEGSWLVLSSIPLSSEEGSSIVPGASSVKLMVLEMDNRGISGASPIVVSDLSFIVEDRMGEAIPPNSVFSEISVVNEQDGTVLGRTSNMGETNPVSIHLSKLLTISTDSNVQISIFGKITEDASASYFQLNLPGEDYVNARDFRSGIGVPVRNVMDGELENLKSEPKRIFYPGVEATFRNVPNPFGEPGKEQTAIIYYLKENTDVTFYIYTLTGALVWSTSYTASDPQGAEGIHSNGASSVTWDGRNENGYMVLNGVYILVMETGYGEVETTKIAVVK